MVKPWDDTLKRLIRAEPQAFVQWFAPEATFVRERLNELDNVKLEMDGLLEAKKDEQAMLVHIEVQTYSDASMAERLLRYNVLARMQYKLPVLSCVLYLLRDRDNPKSPLIWEVPNKEEILQFHFRSIDVGKLSAEDILRTNQPGLYPLLPLTEGGARREKVEIMFGKLGGTGKTELELIGFTLASLVFNRENKADQDWLIRRFHEMHDILRETPIYQEILKEGREEGLEKGREEGREEGQIEALRRAVVQIVLQRFPKLVRLAREKVAFAEDSDILLDLIGKLSVAADAENAKQCLLAMDESLEDLT
ncbi:MAG: hypothetical protein ACJ8BW_29040 [Ktedonobacteraceae bacterium]